MPPMPDRSARLPRPARSRSAALETNLYRPHNAFPVHTPPASPPPPSFSLSLACCTSAWAGMASFQVNSLFDVKGKVVLITGGSRGIGKMVRSRSCLCASITGVQGQHLDRGAYTLVDRDRVHQERLEGASLLSHPADTQRQIRAPRTTLTRCPLSAQVYISSRSAKDCAATEQELNALGPGTCVAIPADMQRLEQVDHLVAELSKRESALHVLVNNAGAAWGDTLDDYPVRPACSCLSARPIPIPVRRVNDAHLDVLCVQHHTHTPRTGLGVDEAPHAQPPARLQPHAEVSSSLACRGRAGRAAGRHLARPRAHH